jgi:hypothetical protein
MFFDDLANGGGHVVEDGVRACAEARGEADGVEALACGSDGGDAEVCASEVHANAEGIHDERKAYDTLRGSGSLQAEQAMLGCWKPDGPTELLQKDAWTESGLEFLKTVRESTFVMNTESNRMDNWVAGGVYFLLWGEPGRRWFWGWVLGLRNLRRLARGVGKGSLGGNS